MVFGIFLLALKLDKTPVLLGVVRVEKDNLLMDGKGLVTVLPRDKQEVMHMEKNELQHSVHSTWRRQYH